MRGTFYASALIAEALTLPADAVPMVDRAQTYHLENQVSSHVRKLATDVFISENRNRDSRVPQKVFEQSHSPYDDEKMPPPTSNNFASPVFVLPVPLKIPQAGQPTSNTQYEATEVGHFRSLSEGESNNSVTVQPITSEVLSGLKGKVDQIAMEIREKLEQILILTKNEESIFATATQIVVPSHRNAIKDRRELLRVIPSKDVALIATVRELLDGVEKLDFELETIGALSVPLGSYVDDSVGRLAKVRQSVLFAIARIKELSEEIFNLERSLTGKIRSDRQGGVEREVEEKREDLAKFEGFLRGKNGFNEAMRHVDYRKKRGMEKFKIRKDLKRVSLLLRRLGEDGTLKKQRLGRLAHEVIGMGLLDEERWDKAQDYREAVSLLKRALGLAAERLRDDSVPAKSGKWRTWDKSEEMDMDEFGEVYMMDESGEVYMVDESGEVYMDEFEEAGFETFKPLRHNLPCAETRRIPESLTQDQIELCELLRKWKAEEGLYSGSRRVKKGPDKGASMKMTRRLWQNRVGAVLAEKFKMSVEDPVHNYDGGVFSVFDSDGRVLKEFFRKLYDVINKKLGEEIAFKVTPRFLRQFGFCSETITGASKALRLLDYIDQNPFGGEYLDLIFGGLKDTIRRRA